jgi:WD40 repeat protein
LSHSGKYLLAGSADKFVRLFSLEESPSGEEIEATSIFEEELDSEVNHVSFSPEDDLMVVSTNTMISLYLSKKKQLLKKLASAGEEVPKRAIFCL